MSRKLWLGIGATLIVVMMIGLSVSGIALARGGNYSQLARTRSVSGTVVQVAADSFTIRTRQGQTLRFLFDNGTQFVNDQKQGVKGPDLVVGKWVTVFATPSDHLRDAGVAGLSRRAVDKSGDVQLDKKQVRSFHASRGVLHHFGSGRSSLATAVRVVIGAQNASPASANPQSPTVSPAAPTSAPQTVPQTAATATPRVSPTAAAPAAPTSAPKALPTATPQARPTNAPYASPTSAVKIAPTATPTRVPAGAPATYPTATP